MKKIITQTILVCSTVGVLSFVTGCQSNNQSSAQPSVQPAAAATPPATPAAVTTPPAATSAATITASAAPAANTVIRIKAGSTDPFTDSSGHVWQAEQGFDGGDVIARDPGLSITNTADPGLYRSEHYWMDSFSINLPNGNYTAKLYFAETYEGITGPGQRVFSFNVQGTDFKDFDVWVKAGGPDTAYVQTVPVTVTNGKFTITFTTNVENPEINAIEIDPQM